MRLTEEKEKKERTPQKIFKVRFGTYTFTYSQDLAAL